MHNNKTFKILLFITVLVVGSISPVVCSGRDSLAPVTKHGQAWRIAYYEGGAYVDYIDSMRAIICGLMELGWIEIATLPQLHDPRKPYWNWLVNQARSRFLQFHAEDAYSAQWSEEKRLSTKRAVIEKLQAGRIDLVIAMGTWAGQDLANNLHTVPTTVVATSNSLQAGIIKSAEDSGFDHVTARVDPSRYLRQIRMFHRLVRFDTLGVVYEDTPDGRLYSALPDLKQVSQERGFGLVLCRLDDANPDRNAAGRDCLACIRKLASDAEAVYLTALLSVDETIDQIVHILKAEKTPSFSMLGSKYVKKGALMSISTDEGYRAQGLYDAQKIARILNGVRPRDLKQEFADPLDIAINIETARGIGFKVPTGIRKVANEIYGEGEN